MSARNSHLELMLGFFTRFSMTLRNIADEKEQSCWMMGIHFELGSSSSKKGGVSRGSSSGVKELIDLYLGGQRDVSFNMRIKGCNACLLKPK